AQDQVSDLDRRAPSHRRVGMDVRDNGELVQLQQYARHRLPDRLGLQPGVHALIRFDFRRSISQRPAGPGGMSVRNTADIAMTRRPSGTSSILTFTTHPLARARLPT